MLRRKGDEKEFSYPQSGAGWICQMLISDRGSLKGCRYLPRDPKARYKNVIKYHSRFPNCNRTLSGRLLFRGKTAYSSILGIVDGNLCANGAIRREIYFLGLSLSLEGGSQAAGGRGGKGQ